MLARMLFWRKDRPSCYFCQPAHQLVPYENVKRPVMAQIHPLSRQAFGNGSSGKGTQASMAADRLKGSKPVLKCPHCNAKYAHNRTTGKVEAWDGYEYEEVVNPSGLGGSTSATGGYFDENTPINPKPTPRTCIELDYGKLVAGSPVLCRMCTHHQTLISQLMASFDPNTNDDEKLFMEKARIYRQDLERRYPLCAVCSSAVKERLEMLEYKLKGRQLATAKSSFKPYDILESHKLARRFWPTVPLGMIRELIIQAWLSAMILMRPRVLGQRELATWSIPFMPNLMLPYLCVWFPTKGLWWYMQTGQVGDWNEWIFVCLMLSSMLCLYRVSSMRNAIWFGTLYLTRILIVNYSCVFLDGSLVLQSWPAFAAALLLTGLVMIRQLFAKQIKPPSGPFQSSLIRQRKREPVVGLKYANDPNDHSNFGKGRWEDGLNFGSLELGSPKVVRDRNHLASGSAADLRTPFTPLLPKNGMNEASSAINSQRITLRPTSFDVSKPSGLEQVLESFSINDSSNFSIGSRSILTRLWSKSDYLAQLLLTFSFLTVRTAIDGNDALIAVVLALSFGLRGFVCDRLGMMTRRLIILVTFVRLGYLTLLLGGYVVVPMPALVWTIVDYLVISGR